MFLLDAKCFRPVHYGKKYYRKDECIIFYNLISNTWELFLNGEIIKNKNTETLKRTLNEITKNLKKEERIICFINNLEYFADIFNGEITSTRKDVEGNKFCCTFETNNIEFRNYSQFHRIPYLEEANVSEMYSFLKNLAKMIGKENINNCKHTVGFMTKQIMSFGIEDKILQFDYKNKKYYNSLREYEDQLIGCKAGLLKSIKGIHDDSFMIDIKSAYLSAFVQLDCFPIGRNLIYFGSSAINEFLKNKWYHIVIETEETVEEFECRKFYKENEKYGFYKFDEELMQLDNVNFKKIVWDLYKRGAKITVYNSLHYGHLLTEYREKMVEMYNYKQQAKKGPNRDAVKIITELIYGKGLQKHEFSSDEECIQYFKRPQNYIRPEYSMLVCSFVRLKLAKMILKLNGCFYADTDGIETKFTQDKITLIEEENKRIIELNKSLGFNTNMGIWEIEETHAKCLIIGKKQRIYYSDNNNLEIKVAGINKSFIERHMRIFNVKDPITYFNKSREVFVGVFCYDEEEFIFKRIAVKIELGEVKQKIPSIVA